MTGGERPPLPPFDAATAAVKARLAEDAWNSRDPQRVSLAYTPDSEWRNRAEFVRGRDAIVAFLQRKWTRELDYRLNGLAIRSEDRLFRWPAGRRPDDHAGLTQLGL